MAPLWKVYIALLLAITCRTGSDAVQWFNNPNNLSSVLIRRNNIYDDYSNYDENEDGYNSRLDGSAHGYQDSDVWEYHKFQHYGYKTKKPKSGALSGLLAFLAPLAALPILAGLAFAGFGGLLIPTVTVNAAAGRRRRETISRKLMTPSWNDWGHLKFQTISNDKKGLEGLDVIQKYLEKIQPQGDYSDEVMATYLKCSGMLDLNNHCLERLVCQFSDRQGAMSDMEKEVASLIIFAILKNKYIEEPFKMRLKKTAIYGRDHPGRCRIFTCSKVDY
ncbi:uncharacterized protein LOC143254557 [Tachypleus tridentatus]|uniref:uncharacterized protein LOC143254557 n=1 Tax=Tachypleus tridentatus TaxID=6853 RepID=UPI003FD29C98